MLKYSLNGSAPWQNLQITWQGVDNVPQQNCPLETGTFNGIQVQNLIPGWFLINDFFTVHTMLYLSYVCQVGSLMMILYCIINEF